jgi:hypothetical protein
MENADRHDGPSTNICNFVKYQPIRKILSTLQSGRIFQLGHIFDVHRTLTYSPHYLVKLKISKISYNSAKNKVDIS